MERSSSSRGPGARGIMRRRTSAQTRHRRGNWPTLAAASEPMILMLSLPCSLRITQQPGRAAARLQTRDQAQTGLRSCSSANVSEGDAGYVVTIEALVASEDRGAGEASSMPAASRHLARCAARRKIARFT